FRDTFAVSGWSVWPARLLPSDETVCAQVEHADHEQQADRYPRWLSVSGEARASPPVDRLPRRVAETPGLVRAGRRETPLPSALSRRSRSATFARRSWCAEPAEGPPASWPRADYRCQ